MHARDVATARNDPEAFWAAQAQSLDWRVAPRRTLDRSSPPFYRWFADGVLNAAYNCLDRHVMAGRGAMPALVYESPVTETRESISYSVLLERTARFAGALLRAGVRRGDRVLIYMPMVPEAAVAMLACARIGAVHSVVFGGFASMELAARIDDAQPVVIITASCGIEPTRLVPYKPLLDAALEMARHRPQACVILQRKQHAATLIAPRDIEWTEFLRDAEPAQPKWVPATHPLYILYTSGTTGQPKGIVRDTGGYLTALVWSLGALYGVQPGDTFWAASDIGWVVGHSYIVYGPLAAGLTSVMYEGKPVGTPDASVYWQIAARNRVNCIFTAPTAIRAIRQADPTGGLSRGHDLSSLRAVFLGGERADAPTLKWLSETSRATAIDHWWQTETGWPVACNPLGLGLYPAREGSCGKPVPGFDVVIANELGEPVHAGTDGEVLLREPTPPGFAATIWGSDDAFQRKYFQRFPGFYRTGDGGRVDTDGYLYVMGRIDDVINVAGHRLSTGQIEEVLATHPAVAECAVFGADDALKGQVPVCLAVLKQGVAVPHSQIEQEIKSQVRATIGPIAALSGVGFAPRLPKTRSGKILRRVLQSIANGTPPSLPSTIEDIGAVEDARQALAALGLPRNSAPQPPIACES